MTRETKRNNWDRSDTQVWAVKCFVETPGKPIKFIEKVGCKKAPDELGAFNEVMKRFRKGYKSPTELAKLKKEQAK